jgi:hypothetical protein
MQSSKNNWPELVGKSGNEAAGVIKAEASDVNV